MAASVPDVIVYLCTNCQPSDGKLPSQWNMGGARVLVREVPCSGKMDSQYLLHALEGGVRGICVAACPKGDCRLVQGNYRAEVRVRTLHRLLGEIGLEPERIELVRCSPQMPFDEFAQAVRSAVERIAALAANPLCNAGA